MDRRKFISFLSAGVAAASIPAQAARPAEVITHRSMALPINPKAVKLIKTGHHPQALWNNRVLAEMWQEEINETVDEILRDTSTQ